MGYFKGMTQAQALPIGVFDSGLGGLTVLKALREALPRENFVYLGDVARLPYGTKSKAIVEQYARQCVEFLMRESVKAIVIACNSASSMALEVLEKEVPVPLYGVVEPGVQAGMKARRNGSILVLGTEATVKSGAYLKRFSQLAPEAPVTQLACPLLVSLAEEGWFDHSVTQQVISHYLQSVEIEKFDTVVLGCTHFPFLEPSFRRVLPPNLSTVHGGAGLAERLGQDLAERGLAHPSGAGKVRLLTTDRISMQLPLLKEWLSEVTESEVVALGGAN